MKNRFQDYTSALSNYEKEADRLSEAQSIGKELIKRAAQEKLPVSNDETLVNHLADPEHRVPSQLYAVIGEILKLIKTIEQK